MRRSRRALVAVVTLVALAQGLAGQASTEEAPPEEPPAEEAPPSGEPEEAEEAQGLVVDDPEGDAVWPLDTSLNASWADLTQFRMATVRDADGEATALQLVYVTAEPPRDDDEHRVFFTTGWNIHDADGEWCSADLWVFDGRAGGSWGPPRADLHYSCDGDDKPGQVYLDLKLIKARVNIDLDGPDGTVTPTRDGSAMVVTIPLSAFGQGQSAGRYHEGTMLDGVYATSGVLWRFMGIGMDQAGGGLLQGRSYSYTIGA